jgi:DHA1 family tetracycline resistance protein-like MFS transporter
VFVRRSPLTVIYMTVFIDLLGFSIILPLLPFYAKHFGATGVWVGALLTAYSAAQFISAPILGRVSDRIGRRPILLLSLAGSALSLALTGFANSLVLLLAGRALAGLFGGSIATAQAYVADTTAPDERAKYMGLLGASIGLGFVFGPAIGAGLSGLGFGAAAFAAAGLAAVNFTFALFKLPESRLREHRAVQRPLPWSRGGLNAFARPVVPRVLTAMFLTTFAFVALEATYALYTQKRYGLNEAGFGMLFAYLGLLIVLVQGGLIGRLHKRYDERSLAAVGAGLMGSAFVCVALAPNLVVALAGITALALGQGLLSPTLPALLSRQSSAHEHGEILGVGQSLSALARAVGPIAGGLLFDVERSLPYLLGGALTLTVATLISSHTGT